MTCTCDICGKKVRDSYNLMRHQQSKKCQALRNLKPPSQRPCECEVCGRVYVRSQRKRHQATKRCQQAKEKLKLKNLLKEKDKEISKLKKPSVNINITNNNNNNTINNIIMTPTSLKDVLTLQAIRDVYTNNDFHDKGIGAARAILSILNKHDENRYICTDPSRNICKFINLNGKEIKDVQNTKLWKAIKEPVKEVVTETRRQLTNEFPENIDMWLDFAKPIMEADDLPPTGFSRLTSTAT